MRVHLVDVAGRGMGQLAMLFRSAGCTVSGSADGLEPTVELVVVAPEVPEDDPEVVRAAELGVPRAGASAALREHFLRGKRPLVVLGRDAPTIAAMCAWILDVAGLEPGFLLRAASKNLGVPARAGGTRRKIIGSSAKPPPFVLDGDAMLGLIDDLELTKEAVLVVGSLVDGEPLGERLSRLAGKMSRDGLVVCHGADPRARGIAMRHPGRTALYALDREPAGDVPPGWLGAPVPADPVSGAQPFDLYAGGSSCGRFALRSSALRAVGGGFAADLRLGGDDAIRSAIAAIAACAEGFGVHIEKARQALVTFEGTS